MKPAIADTSALISLVSLSDANHARAVGWSQQALEQNITTIIPGEVHTEFMNIFGKKADHQEAIRTGEIMLFSPEYQVVETTTERRERAFELFREQKQSVSFTDCIVMAFADKYQTKDIFGFDGAFADNGYTRVGWDDLPEKQVA
jgi:predicted nucleic acid-binding protein